ncbi:MAG: M57 family metalloprotease [Tannerella sp.]|jgi:hypothetical protein|nr:M57 family metalloprotease [Tannerella sp.]
MKKILLLSLAFVSFACSNQADDLLSESTSQEIIEDFGNKKELVDLGNGFFAEKVDDVYIFEGDMLFGYEALLSYIEENYKEPDTSVSTRSFALKSTKKWTDATIYYTFNSNVPADFRPQILSAMDDWSISRGIGSMAFKPLKFIQRTNQKNYVEFIMISDSLVGGYSYTGMIGGKQQIQFSIQNTNVNTIKGIALHEIGHAIGLDHPHQAPDRDKYIKVLSENIMDQYKYAFNKKSGSIYGGFGSGLGVTNPVSSTPSIMMYSSYAFSKNGKPTITRLDNSTFSANSTTITLDDWGVISVMYK